MDSKDLSLPTSSSSSSSSVAAASPAEEDSALSAAVELARDASMAFHSGKFTECVDVLNQLLQKKENDPKVHHNIAIARHFQDGCSDPKKLFELLNNVKERSEELVRASGENAESVSNMGNKAVSGSKGANNHQFSSSNSLPIVYADEYDTSVTMLNIAIIWFHLHEYAKAYRILDSLYQKIEPIDEATALHICLLFLDVALASQDPWKFIDVISYVEKAYCLSNLVAQNDNGSSMQQQSSSLVAKSSSFPSNSTPSDPSNNDSVAGANTSESPLSRTLSEENLETLISTIDLTGQNLARPSGLQSSTDFLKTPEHSISTSDLRLKLHLYKVRFLLLTRNLKAAKREVKLAMAMNVAHGKDSSMALLLKSQLEYARGNYRKAIKLLMASGNRTEIGISGIYNNNNLGCIYSKLGKYHSSTVFFSKALGNCSSLRKERPLKLSTIAQDKSFQIMYNCGVQYLACGKPELAARCFHKASSIFFDWPIFWLRIAECCLMGVEKGIIKSSTAQSDGLELKVQVIGKGKWRQLAMEDGVLGNRHLEFVGKDDLFVGGDKQINLSLPLARQCLLNALYLLTCLESKHSKSGLPHDSNLEDDETEEGSVSAKITNFKTLFGTDLRVSNVMVGSGQITINGDMKEQKGGSNANATLHSSLSDYEDVCKQENHMIEQALLADLAFIELELGNPLNALSAARSLLELPECSRIYIYLGHMYAAESLCLLNRPKEAAEQFSMYLPGAGNVELPYSEEDREAWRVEKNMDSEESNGTSVDESQDAFFLKPEEARGALYVNLAMVSTVQGDLEQAHQFVSQALSVLPNSPEALVTAIYIDLLSGKTQEALAKLKQCNRVRFLPGNSALESTS